MKKGRFNEEQIIGILKRHEAGQKVAEQQTRSNCNRAVGLSLWI